MYSYFISSTFRDMQSERDILSMNILPRLRSFANELGEDVGFVDLRCGIDTEALDSAAEMKKILSVCMNKIDDCFPLFVILLGNRYGSLPDMEILEKFLLSEEGSDFTADNAAGKSITELEITHFLNLCKKYNCDPKNCLTICIRESDVYEKIPEKYVSQYVSDAEDDIKKLNALKEHLTRSYPDCIMYYSADWDNDKNCISSLSEFKGKLTERLLAQVKGRISNDSSLSIEEQLSLHCKYIVDDNAALFVDYSGLLDTCLRVIDKSTHNLLIIGGDSGMGKTTLSAALCQRYAKGRIIPAFCGTHKHLSDCKELLQYLIWSIENIFSLPHRESNSYETLLHHFKNLMNCHGHEVILLIDGVDKLSHDSHFKSFDFLPIASFDKYSIVLTTGQTQLIPKHIVFSSGSEYLSMPKPDGDTILSLAKSIYKKLGKDLPISIADTLVAATAHHTPLYLSLAIARINLLSESDYCSIAKNFGPENGAYHINRYYENILNNLPSTLDGLATEILRITSRFFDGDLSSDIIRILDIFSDGCSPHDMVNIINAYHKDSEANLLALTVFIKKCADIFEIKSNGYIYFSHNIKPSIANDGDYDTMIKTAFDYLSGLPIEDPLRLKYFIPISKLCSKPRDGAIYIAEIYNKYDTELRNSPDEGDNIAEAVMVSIRSLFTRSIEEATDFCLKMFHEAECFPPYAINRFCSCFLFTYDTLFGELHFSEACEKIMSAIYHAEAKLVYPEALKECKQLLSSGKEPTDEVIEQLRNVYVSLEQCGIRTNDYFRRREMFEAFNKMALWLLENVSKEAACYKYLVADTAISYEKLADVNENSYSMAQELCKTGIGIIEEHYPDYESNPMIYAIYISLLYKYAKADIDRAKTAIQMGRNAEGLLSIDSCRDILGRAEKYYIDNKDNHKLSRHNLLSVLMSKTEMYSAGGEAFKKLQYQATLEIIDAGKEWFFATGDPMAIDRIRNGYFRIAYSEDMDITNEERLSAIDISLEALLYIEKNGYFPIPQKLWEHTVGTFVKLHNLRVEEIKSNAPKNQKAILDEGYYVVSRLGKRILYAKDSKELKYSASTNTLLAAFFYEISVLYRDVQRKMKKGSLINVLEDALMLDKCHQSLHDIIREQSWLSVAIEIKSILMYIYEELYHAENPNGIPYSELEYQCEEAGMFYALIYKAKYGKTVIPKNISYAIKYYGKINPAPWVLFAAYCFDSGTPELFFGDAESRNHSFPGGNASYLERTLLLDLNNSRFEGQGVGKYLSENLHDGAVSSLLTDSDYMACLTLEYAYKAGDYVAADYIFDLRGDYPELPMLYLCAKYDRYSLGKYIEKMSDSCMIYYSEEYERLDKVLKSDPLLCDIEKRLIRKASEKISCLRERNITWNTKAVYIVEEAVYPGGEKKYMWAAYSSIPSSDNYNLIFLRAGFEDADITTEVRRGNILASIPSRYEKVTWLSGYSSEKNDSDAADQELYKLKRRICRFARRMATKFRVDLASENKMHSDFLNAISYFFTYEDQTSRRNSTLYFDKIPFSDTEYMQAARYIIRKY